MYNFIRDNGPSGFIGVCKWEASRPYSALLFPPENPPSLRSGYRMTRIYSSFLGFVLSDA